MKQNPNNTGTLVFSRRIDSYKNLFLVPLCCLLVGCMTAAKHQQQLGSNHDKLVTLGLVQKEIQVGMSQADVAIALGSPNLVTGDLGNREVWVYDKVASEVTFSSDSGGVSSTLSGAATFPAQNFGDSSGNASGNIMSGYSRSAGATSFSQRTLTVVIKFTSDKAVESVSYNSTRF